MQSVDALGPGPTQLGPPVHQQSQRIELRVVGQHPKRRGAHRDHGDGVCVMGVGLAVVPSVEQPRPRRQLRRHIHHVLTVGQQSLRQRSAGAVAALHRPGSIAEPGDVFAHRGVPGLVGAEPACRQHGLALVDDLDGCRQLVGIDPDEHPRHELRPSCRRRLLDAGRALLLRAGQTLTLLSDVTGLHPTVSRVSVRAGSQVPLPPSGWLIKSVRTRPAPPRCGSAEA